MRLARMTVGLRAVGVSRMRMLLGLIVTAGLVMMSGLPMMVGGGFVARGGRMVMRTGRMFSRRHESLQ
ncbi:MAG TPA: hypothetical protein VK801_12895 [Caulobacteraceae bacterium]|nr:hypothetical protein [Caulobacteraceae bacterium]